ncbi:MAG: hypothetical protein MRZ79_12175 [Bacteroidia bacterium]|nr:hypothetical protein [Bacteroidia bacterium]
MSCKAEKQPLPEGKGALLLTDFASFEEFKQVVDIEYGQYVASTNPSIFRPFVRLRHRGAGKEVSSVLRKGMSEHDFKDAKKGGFWAKVWLVINTPYGLWKKNDIKRVYALSKRRGAAFGEGDVAFYDLAQNMMLNIDQVDRKKLTFEELGEKGFINTFNHVTAQAFVSSIFTEDLADYIADTHERANMAELISGDFSEAQIADMKTGPTDNYLDIINNEWGQELGKRLRKKYKINRRTQWTPMLLRQYLNEVQSYYSWCFDIGFEPFTDEDEVVIRFSKKINRVLKEVPSVN